MSLCGDGTKTPTKTRVKTIHGDVHIDCDTGQDAYELVRTGDELRQGTPLRGGGSIEAECTQKHQQKKPDKRMQSVYAEYNDYFASTVVLLSVGSAFGLYLGGWSIHDVLMTNMSLLMIACGCVFTLAENAADHMIHKTRHLKYQRDRDRGKTEEKFKAWCESIYHPVFISGRKSFSTTYEEKVKELIQHYFGTNKTLRFIDAQMLRVDAQMLRVDAQMLRAARVVQSAFRKRQERQQAKAGGSAAAAQEPKPREGEAFINIYYNAGPVDKAKIATDYIKKHPGFPVAFGDWRNDEFLAKLCKLFYGFAHKNNLSQNKPEEFGAHASIIYDGTGRGTVQSHKDHPGLLYGAIRNNPKKKPKILCFFDLNGTTFNREKQPGDDPEAQEHKGLFELENTWLRYLLMKQQDMCPQAVRMVERCYRFAMAYNVLAYSLIIGLALGTHQTLSPNLSALLMWVSLGAITCIIQYAQRQADKDNVPPDNNPSLLPQSHPTLTRTQSACTPAQAAKRAEKQAAAARRAEKRAAAVKRAQATKAEVEVEVDTPMLRLHIVLR